MIYSNKFFLFIVFFLIIYQQPTMANVDQCYYQVIKVQKGDTLVIRFGPAIKYRKIGAIPYNGTVIEMTGPDIKIGKSRWVPIKYQDMEGWINRGYLSNKCHKLMKKVATASNQSVYHTVDFGETLFSISQQYGYKVAEIVRWNHLQPPYKLLIGQHLRVSPCLYHVVKVKENDMLWIRSKVNLNSKKIGAIPYNGIGIQITGEEKILRKSRWVPIKYKGIEGWVNRNYLEEDC